MNLARLRLRSLMFWMALSTALCASTSASSAPHLPYNNFAPPGDALMCRNGYYATGVEERLIDRVITVILHCAKASWRGLNLSTDYPENGVGPADAHFDSAAWRLCPDNTFLMSLTVTHGRYEAPFSIWASISPRVRRLVADLAPVCKVVTGSFETFSLQPPTKLIGAEDNDLKTDPFKYEMACAVGEGAVGIALTTTNAEFFTPSFVVKYPIDDNLPPFSIVPVVVCDKLPQRPRPSIKFKKDDGKVKLKDLKVKKDD